MCIVDMIVVVVAYSIQKYVELIWKCNVIRIVMNLY